MENSKSSKLCPSYAAKPGSQLFGIVNRNGFIDYLENTLEVNEPFMEEASKGRNPEERFRFAGNCAKSGCSQWNDGKEQCGLIDKIIKIVDNTEKTELQPCPIRSQCRWYDQRQGLACAQCNEIIRNIEMKIVNV
ncbi:MAG TPA: hypothetical protein ENH91_03330 [Leeuwenhoekiella sp.]|nr:hypothetical protein [Leeuwenhoekiella sp.]